MNRCVLCDSDVAADEGIAVAGHAIHETCGRIMDAAREWCPNQRAYYWHQARLILNALQKVRESDVQPHTSG